MVVYNYSGKEINAKIVYYGPALSGKTTNLEWIYSKIPLEYSGKMISLRTQTDRTIFFDFLPLELGLIDGFKTRFMLYTVPGQVYYNATRKMVLKGADGVVFVADSEEGRMQDNLESLQNLKENLQEIGLDPATIPIVLQWNKRDLPSTIETEQLERQLNPEGHPSFSACALTGEGVYESLHQISRMIYRNLATEEGTIPQESGNQQSSASLFGEDIETRLRDVDHPDPTLKDSVTLQGPPTVKNSGSKGSSVLSSILGSLQRHARGASENTDESQAPEKDSGPSGGGDGTEVRQNADAPWQDAPRSEHTQEDTETVTVGTRTVSAAGEGKTRADSPTGFETKGPQTMSQTPTPSGDPLGQQQARADSLQDEPTRPVARSQPEQPQNAPLVDETVADLVDTLFSPKDSAESEETAENDDLAYESGFGRMVDLGPDSQAGKRPPKDDDFELPEDLLESGGFTAVPAKAEEEEESLELITDPRKKPMDSGSGPGIPVSADYQTGAFKPLSGSTRTIEVPITLDADLLAEGQAVRIVLNLKVQR